MSKRVIIRVSQDSMDILRNFAEESGIDVGSAADQLISSKFQAVEVKASNGNSEVMGADLLNKIQEVASDSGKSLDATVARIVKMGLSRHKALSKYAKAKSS